MAYQEDSWRVVAPDVTTADSLWLQPLEAFVTRLVVFGCWDDGPANRACGEAYVLLRLLSATHATVVDKEAAYIRNAQCWFEDTRQKRPDLFGEWDLEFAVHDMTSEADQLPTNGFDRACCSGVLYFPSSDPAHLQAAVNTLFRAVEPGGWVIAREDKGLVPAFDKPGLKDDSVLHNDPQDTYCYRKPLSTDAGTRMIAQANN